MNLQHATIISLKEFEDEALLHVKPTRNRAEYCWTSTSSTILYVLEHFGVDMCTYLDADLMFFDSPKPLFDEMGDASIMITEHRYSPQYNKEAKSGKYCVQFVSVRNDERGLNAIRWWRERCLEWCYARYEDGKFGDQMYLDDWTTRFEGVHELQHLGGGMAAWNIQQYDVFMKNGRLWGREKKSGNEFPVIFYHFHYLRFLQNELIELGRRVLSDDVVNLLYSAYIKELEKSKKIIAGYGLQFDSHGASAQEVNWKAPILFVYRKLFGIYNIFPLKKFLNS